MSTLIILSLVFGVVAFVVILATIKDSHKGNTDVLISFVGASSVAVAVGLLFSAVLTDDERTIVREDSSTVQIQALHTGTTASGYLSFGAGVYGEQRTINYLVKAKDESGKTYAQTGQVLAAGVNIYQDETDAPYMESVDTYVYEYNFFGALKGKHVSSWQTSFHIPEGSVVEEFEVTNK